MYLNKEIKKKKKNTRELHHLSMSIIFTIIILSKCFMDSQHNLIYHWFISFSMCQWYLSPIYVPIQLIFWSNFFLFYFFFFNMIYTRTKTIPQVLCMNRSFIHAIGTRTSTLISRSHLNIVITFRKRNGLCASKWTNRWNGTEPPTESDIAMWTKRRLFCCFCL